MTRMFYVYAMHSAEKNGNTAKANELRKMLMDWPMESPKELDKCAPYRPEFIEAVVKEICK